MKKIIIISIVTVVVILLGIYAVNNLFEDDTINLKGTVMQVVDLENGISILIGGGLDSDTETATASITVNNKANVYKEGIKNKVGYTEIKEGDIVEITLDGPLLLSYPAQGAAKSITILN